MIGLIIKYNRSVNLAINRYDITEVFMNYSQNSRYTSGAIQSQNKEHEMRNAKDNQARGRMRRYYNHNNLINRHSVAGRTRTVARTVGSDQGQ